MPSRTQHSSPRTLGQDLRARARVNAVLATRAAIAVAIGLSVAFISGRGETGPSIAAASEVGVQPAHVALAHSFTAALNAHDVEALVDLFSEDGPGATVHADRYAWTKYEIRLWAQHQTRANIRVDAYEYWATDYGAGWNATVHRDDFSEAGIDGLPVFNTIFVEGGKIMDFTSKLANPRDAERLEHLWRPGSLPDYAIR